MKDEPIIDDYEMVLYLKAALRKISKGAGAYNPDRLTHASNCIQSMKATAVRALDGTWSPGEGDLDMELTGRGDR